MKYTVVSMPQDLTRKLREAIVNKFNPHTESDPRQIWDLWYMHEQYCYLISHVDKIFSPDVISEFRSVRDAKFEQLDLPHFSIRCSEQIHVYVNGCFQGLHNDSTRAGYSYVYYLQDDIHFTGGQTRLFTKDFPDPKLPAAGTAYYDEVQPQCSTMVVFDNSTPHMVPVVQGTMNPTKGRITLCSRLLV